MSFVIIPSGYTGVKTTFGQIAEETLPNGFNWKTPFIESIEIVNNKQQDAGFARKCAEVVTINPETTSTSEPDDFEMAVFNKYRNGDFDWLKDWEPETKVIVIKEDNKSQED